MIWPRNAKSAGKSLRQLSLAFRRRVMRLNALSRLDREKRSESKSQKPESLNETDPTT